MVCVQCGKNTRGRPHPTGKCRDCRGAKKSAKAKK